VQVEERLNGQAGRGLAPSAIQEQLTRNAAISMSVNSTGSHRRGGRSLLTRQVVRVMGLRYK